LKGTPRIRRVWVPYALEHEVLERVGKYVKLDGRTYLVAQPSRTQPEAIEVSLVEGRPREDDELHLDTSVRDIEHWMRR